MPTPVTPRSSTSRKAGAAKQQHTDARRKADEAKRVADQEAYGAEGHAEIDVVNVDQGNEQGNEAPANFAQALQGARQANQDLQLLAAAMGVDFGKLLLCIAQKIGWLGLIRCLRSGSGVVDCVTNAVDMEGILQCAGAAVSPPGFTGADEQSDDDWSNAPEQ